MLQLVFCDSADAITHRARHWTMANDCEYAICASCVFVFFVIRGCSMAHLHRDSICREALHIVITALFTIHWQKRGLSSFVCGALPVTLSAPFFSALSTVASGRLKAYIAQQSHSTPLNANSGGRNIGHYCYDYQKNVRSAAYSRPGITAFRPSSFSLPNFFSYHRLPCSARGSIVVISLMRKLRPGWNAHPPIIHQPAHSIHSHR
jgi:hypothetical protein